MLPGARERLTLEAKRVTGSTAAGGTKQTPTGWRLFDIEARRIDGTAECLRRAVPG